MCAPISSGVQPTLATQTSAPVASGWSSATRSVPSASWAELTASFRSASGCAPVSARRPSSATAACCAALRWTAPKRSSSSGWSIECDGMRKRGAAPGTMPAERACGNARCASDVRDDLEPGGRLEQDRALAGRVRLLAMLRDVEAEPLRALRDAERRHEPDRLEEEERRAERVHRPGRERDPLPRELTRMAEREAVRDPVPALLREEADEEHPGDPREAVRCEYVERLVEPGARTPDDERVARHRGERAERERRHGGDVACRGRDPDGTDDDRRRRADRGHLPAAPEIEDEPDDERARRREQCVREREDADVAGIQRGAAVEPEPSDPEQPGAEQGVDAVVGQQRRASVVFARADDERRREGGEARRGLDRGPAG